MTDQSESPTDHDLAVERLAYIIFDGLVRRAGYKNPIDFAASIDRTVWKERLIPAVTLAAEVSARVLLDCPELAELLLLGVRTR